MVFKKGNTPWNKNKTANIDSRICSGLMHGNYQRIFSKETREKMSVAQKGKSSPFRGCNHSLESRKKMSKKIKELYITGRKIAWHKGKKTGLIPRTAFKKGQVAWNKGKRCPQISIALKGRKHTKEARVKMSKSQRGRIPWNKGKKLSDSHRKALSKSHKGQIPSHAGGELPQIQWDKHPNFTTGWQSYRKHFQRNGGEFICKICGKVGGFEQRCVEIHHIDKNKHNNNFDNLMALCVSHHRKVDLGVIPCPSH